MTMPFKSMSVMFIVIATIAYLPCLVACTLFAISRPQAKITTPSLMEVLPTCDSLVYCQGDLLHTVQMARLSDDSKTFVDKSMRHDVATTLSNFRKLMEKTGGRPSKHKVKAFVDKNFTDDRKLVNWIPEDFKEKPPFLSNIRDSRIRQFAKATVALWKILGRKIKSDVQKYPDRHSLIYIPHGFIIPGGRFREYYYWDTYWIIEGLLVSGMKATARGMIDNFLELVRQYGHVPNGGRIYYQRRSQPPLLSHMAKLYYEETRDIVWLKKSIQLLEKEVNFWRKNRMFTINVNNQKYKLAAYHAETTGPRPESYYEDYTLGSSLKSENERLKLYTQLKSAAESGWDFSSRWLFDNLGGENANLSFINTSRVAAVDLNAFLYGAYSNIAQFYGYLNKTKKQLFWNRQANDLNKTINHLLWNVEDGIWYDLDLELLTQRRYFTPANLAPLWTKAYNTEEQHTTALIEGVITYLKTRNILAYPGGIPTSTINTGEQWDLPNAWPCLQSIVVEGLESSGVKKGQLWARNLAKKWVRAVMIGFNRTGQMFEKYSATIPGQYGEGGEYKVQTGFGWTNGNILKFIQTYYTN